jgi:large subunit ribosomal protein L11
MAKKVKAIIKLQIQAGKATPAPPVGPAVAPHGVNISEFCQKFNAATKDKMGSKIPVILTVFEDRSYDFITKEPPASELIMKELGIEKGSGEPNTKKIGKITKAQLKAVAEKKMPDLNANDMEAAIKIIAGTAKNMGLVIEE